MKTVIIEDQVEFLERWETKIKEEGHDVKCFQHVFDFVEFYYDNRDELDLVDVIIIDRYARSFDAIENDFPKNFLKTFPNYKGKLILSSGTVTKISNAEFGFDLIIPKKYQPISYLMRKIKK